MFGGGSPPDCDCSTVHCNECCCENDNESSSKIGEGNNETNECCHECPNCAKFWAFLGVAFAAFLCGKFVWIIMKFKLNKLNTIQQKQHSKFKKEISN